MERQTSEIRTPRQFAHPNFKSRSYVRIWVPPRRFIDIFKQVTGSTFNVYLNPRRIEFAIERLRETRHILYACYESGFSDPAYFYRVFKKQTGMTPGTFLKTIRSPQ